MTGKLFNIQKFSINDGPGIRTTVFFKGCPLQCKWCSNPESQNRNAAIADAMEDETYSGREYTVEEVLCEVRKDKPFYDESGGGMTLSGGEPLMHADIALPLLREARHRRIKTAIETCGCIPWDTLKEAAPYLNYVLFDVKQMDSEKHREGVGVGNELILSNLKKLLTEFPNLHVQVRTPIIPGFNDNDEFAYALGEFLKGYENVGYEALPYHRLGTQKYDFLSREYAMGDVSLPDGVAQRIQRIVDETRGAVTEEKK